MTIITIQEIIPVTTKTGGTMYRVKGHDGVAYGFGFDKPPYNVGDTIEFEETMNGSFKNAKKGTHKKVDPSLAPPVAQQQPATTNSGGNFKNANFRESDSIIYQESLGMAIDVIKFAIEQGAIKLPAKANEKYGVLNALIGEVANEYSWKAKHPKIMDPEEYAMTHMQEDTPVEGEIVEKGKPS